MRFLTAYGNALIAMLEKYAEDVKRYPESQWWRGYESGFRDAQQMQEATDGHP